MPPTVMMMNDLPITPEPSQPESLTMCNAYALWIRLLFLAHNTSKCVEVTTYATY